MRWLNNAWLIRYKCIDQRLINDIYFCKKNRILVVGFQRKAAWFTSLRVLQTIHKMVWCYGWTTCILYDGPLWVCFFKWQLVCNLGRLFIFLYQFLVLVCLYITQVLPVIFPLYVFYSEIPFYIKYFLLPYSIDVVSILSYQINSLLNHWKSSTVDITSNPILRTYKLFKKDLKFETFLDVVKDNRYRHALIKLWTSSYSLEIERGRYNKTDVKKRLWPCCMRIDDESTLF